MITAEKFADIIEFAITSHKGQTRKGDGRPYITHPLSVMHRVNEVKRGSKNIYLLGGVALLHDVCEDCGVSVDEIAERFGHSVASIVAELTLDKTKYETIGKTKYLSEHMADMSSYALTIKLCDRLDNICDMQSMPDEFVSEYTEETASILSYLETHRKLTKTQKKLVRKIYKELENY